MSVFLSEALAFAQSARKHGEHAIADAVLVRMQSILSGKRKPGRKPTARRAKAVAAKAKPVAVKSVKAVAAKGRKSGWSTADREAVSSRMKKYWSKRRAEKAKASKPRAVKTTGNVTSEAA